MIPRRIFGATHRLGKPGNWDAESNGDCVHLWIKIENGVCWSAWEPTPEELERLNAGASVVLGIVGGQPPVSLAIAEVEPEPT